MNTYPVGTRFGTPPPPCTLSSFCAALAVTKVHEYLPSASDDQTSRLETPCWVGSLYVSARPGFQAQVGSVAEVSRFGRGFGLETRPGPIHPTPGVDVARLVCALASLSVWWRHREWAPFPGYPLARARADRWQLLLLLPLPNMCFQETLHPMFGDGVRAVGVPKRCKEIQ